MTIFFQKTQWFFMKKSKKDTLIIEWGFFYGAKR
jgi:hypothetical protein